MKNKKIALITGASSGIGLATAQLFKKQGWHVVGVAKEPKKISGMDYYAVDLADQNQLEDFIGIFLKKYRFLNVLVNNAACHVSKSFERSSREDWAKVFQVNLFAPVQLARSTAPLLSKVQGAIVNVSSVHALATSQEIASYTASKAALVGLTRSLAVELGAKGIRANAVLPGAVDTPMLKEGLMRAKIKGATVQEKLKEMGRHHLLGKVGAPEDIAEAIYFLSDSSKSAFITGQTLIVDGGALAKLSTE